MARIRTIKPEFWTSEQVAECSPTARLLFVGLWNFCDDAGRHPASLKRLKMEVFPGDAFSDGELQGWIDELIKVGLVAAYEFEGHSYWQVTGWHHQKIDKPTYKYGPLNSEGFPRPFDDDSWNAQRVIEDRSPCKVGTVQEGNGKEGSSAGDDAKLKSKRSQRSTKRPRRWKPNPKLEPDDFLDLETGYQQFEKAVKSGVVSEEDKLRFLTLWLHCRKRHFIDGIGSPGGLLVKAVNDQEWDGTDAMEDKARQWLKDREGRNGETDHDAIGLAMVGTTVDDDGIGGDDHD